MACAVQVLDENYLAISALVTLGIQGAFFVVAAGFKFDKVTDFAGGSNFVVLALLTLVLAGTFFLRQLLVTFAIVLWGLRLSGYLLVRILKTGSDARFDSFDRGFSLSFAGFWAGQAVWVWVVSLPVTLLNASCESDPVIGWLDWLGLLFFFVGVMLEAVADQQKFEFKNDEANKGRWCDVGVWTWSRHPNYFGEMLVWIGVFSGSSSALGGWALLLSALSPIFIDCLLLFASGLPILEASADKRYGDKEDYKKYKAETSVLIPVPPSVYASIPRSIKTTLLCDWPIYNKPREGEAGQSYERIE
mmetsp:Transcript_52113/g.127237  ORF Transcript_52113/g.127237 Transcript_52113/m.127237 type:complete len:304 (+) Transcript_52113:181-1092(+)